MIFGKPNYERMTPAEFQKESIRLFQIRMELEQALMILNTFDRVSANAISEQRKNVILSEYTMQKTIDISSYEPGKKSICISINPIILKNGALGLSSSLTIGNKAVREKDIDLELKYMRKHLLIHMNQMRRYYKQMRTTKSWPDLYRR